jgi:hypothetical protein
VIVVRTVTGDSHAVDHASVTAMLIPVMTWQDIVLVVEILLVGSIVISKYLICTVCWLRLSIFHTKEKKIKILK